MAAVLKERAYCATDVEADDSCRRLRIVWSDGRRSSYPYIWLRHALFHPALGREGQGPDGPCLFTEDPVLPTISSVRRNDSTIEIAWGHDRSTTRHDLVWLRDNCLSEEGRAERRRTPKSWEKRDAEAFPWFDFEKLGDPAERLRLYIQLRDYGLVQVRDVPVRPEALRDVAKWFGPIHVTHFGEIFDIRSKPEDQLGVGANIGATQASAQAPHTDETYNHSPLGILFFHCICPDPSGGGASIYVDGIAAAQRLRKKNPEAFKFLTSVPIMYAAERNPTERMRTRARVIATDADGIIRGVRMADRTLPPLDLPENLIEPAYEALAAFRAELYDYSRAIERVLQPGECTILDNHRVLHARRAFNKQAGERWLQQLSVNRDEFHNQLRVLAEAQGCPEEASFEQDAGMLVQPAVPL